MGFIYIIKNTINDKVYIGQTTRSIDKRWSGHLNSSKFSLAKLYRAMRDLGTDKFFIEKLEECDNSELDDREIYYIKLYNSYNKGYNSTTGGQFSRTMEPEWLPELYEDYKNNMSYKEMSIKYNVSLNYINDLLLGNLVERDVKYNHNSSKRSVVAYDKLFNPLKWFKTIKDAIDWVNNNTEYKVSLYNGYTYIGAACEKGNIAYGMHWQDSNSLTYGDMLFRTKFDKEAYLNGGRAYVPDGKDYFIVDKALDNVESYMIELEKAKDKRTITVKGRYYSDNKVICTVCNKNSTGINNKMCAECYREQLRTNSKRIDAQTLQELLSKYSYEEIGRQYNVTGKAVRKWADSYGLVESKPRDSSGVTCVELNLHFNTFKEAAEYLIQNGLTSATNIGSLGYKISQAKKTNTKYQNFHWK